MFFLPDTGHPAWLIAGDLLLHLLLFVAVTAIVVFILRGPMRQYKPTDMVIFKKLEPWQNKRNDKLMLFITFLGNHQVLIPANLLLIGAFLFFGTHHWYALRILYLSLSSLLLMFVLKYLFHRKRPGTPLLFEARGKSFPSGHAMMSVTFYGLLLVMLLQTNADPLMKIAATIITILLIFLIGFSRVYFRVHYASDVLAGFIIGCCWFYISLHVLGRLEEFF